MFDPIRSQLDDIEWLLARLAKDGQPGMVGCKIHDPTDYAPEKNYAGGLYCQRASEALQRGRWRKWFHVFMNAGTIVREALVSVAIHELAHALDLDLSNPKAHGKARPKATAKVSETECRETVRLCLDSPIAIEIDQWLFHHGLQWHWTLLTIVHRAREWGFFADVEQSLSYSRCRHYGGAAYWEAVQDKLDRLSGRPLGEVLTMEPPRGLARLHARDVEHYLDRLARSRKRREQEMGT